jgi:aconitate hydratase
MDFDFETDSLGNDHEGQPVLLADIWPNAEEVQSIIASSIDTEMFSHQYSGVFDGDERWQNLPTPAGVTFDWDADSTYVRKPPYFEGMNKTPSDVTDISGARVLAALGDSITTDHISPAGTIKAGTPAAEYLEANGVGRSDYNSYGSRRGNHEVMIRGTFANIRLRNQLLDDVEGGYTRDFTEAAAPQAFIYDASEKYQAAGTPLVIFAGKEYGSGSSRDWAAKGTSLLGVRAVITESFERIHRSNLIGMGVLPLQFPAGQTWATLGLDGTEVVSISGITELNDGATPKTVRVSAVPSEHSAPGKAIVEFDAIVRIDTPGEADYYRNGGILQYVLRSLVA